MGDPPPGLDITINPCTCSLCASAVKAGDKPIHDKARKVQVRGWDPQKKEGQVAPPAIPPDPDIEKEKGPKGINTPNLLKSRPPQIGDEVLSGVKIHKWHRGCRVLAPPLWRGGVFALGMVVIWFSMIFSIAFLGMETQPKNLALEVVAEDLAFPIKFDVAPDGRIFYNEFVNGAIRIIEDGVVLEEPFAIVDVFVEGGATGLIGIAIQEPFLYVFYTYSRHSGEAVCTIDAAGPVCEEGIVVANRVSRFRDMGNVAGPEEVIIEDLPAGKWADKAWDHFGGDLKFGPDGKLYVSVGDAVNHLAAQDLSRLNGKILRLNPDGSIPDDNPFPGSPIYLLGVRNVFGMTFLGDTLYFSDNGPIGHDEVNFGVAGGNYGWPYFAGNVTWEEYAGWDEPIPDGAYIDPIIDFTPAIAPTGVAYYTGDKLGGRPYTRVVFLGSFLNYNLTALRLNGGEWHTETVLYVGFSILGMVDGPDGYLYLSTFDKIVRVVLE